MYNDDLIFVPIISVVMAAIGCFVAYALGFFVYGSVNGGMAIILMCVIYGAMSVIALVPFIGFLIHTYAMLTYAWPVISEMMGIEASLLTTIVFALYVFMGFLFTVTSTKIAARQ